MPRSSRPSSRPSRRKGHPLRQPGAGEARPESDYDLLVVVPPEYKTMRVWKDLYLAVSKAKRGFSLDLLLATAEDLEKYRDAWATLYPKVLREGRVLYAP